MSCSTFYFSGQGECTAFREKVAGVILTKKNQVALSETAAATLSTWADVFANATEQLGTYIPFSRGYQNNTTEAEMTTSNLGLTEKTFDSPPMIKGFGELSYCDYKTLFQIDGATFDVFLVLKDGSLEGYQKADATIRGRRAKVYVNFNAPSADNLQESFPIDISFLDVNEWKENSYTVKPNFSVLDLQDSLPVGLSISVVTPYATGGNVVVKAVKRCSNTPATNLTTSDNWKVLYSLGDPSVTVTTVNAASAAFGLYTLTIKSNTTEDLTLPVVIRAEDEGDVAGQLAYVSQTMQVNP